EECRLESGRRVRLRGGAGGAEGEEERPDYRGVREQLEPAGALRDGRLRGHRDPAAAAARCRGDLERDEVTNGAFLEAAMHTIKVIAGGFLLLGAFLLLGRWIGWWKFSPG